MYVCWFSSHTGFQPPPLHSASSQERLIGDDIDTTTDTFVDNPSSTSTPSAPKRMAPRLPPSAPMGQPSYSSQSAHRGPSRPAPPKLPVKPSAQAPQKPMKPPVKPAAPTDVSVGRSFVLPQSGDSSKSTDVHERVKPAGAVPLLPGINPSQGALKKAMKPPKQWPPN